MVSVPIMVVVVPILFGVLRRRMGDRGGGHETNPSLGMSCADAGRRGFPPVRRTAPLRIRAGRTGNSARHDRVAPPRARDETLRRRKSLPGVSRRVAARSGRILLSMVGCLPAPRAT